MIIDHILEKEVSVIAFNFFQKFYLMHAFSITQSWLIWKSSLELNLLIQNSVQQDYLPELFPITSPLNIYGKPWGWGRTLSNSQHLLISLARKIPLNKFTSFFIKNESVIPSPSNSNFHLITLYKLHLWL